MAALGDRMAQGIRIRSPLKMPPVIPAAQTVKKVLQMAKVIRRLQDSHRIDRLCRLGGEFSVVK